jgi:hypothetical protein
VDLYSWKPPRFVNMQTESRESAQWGEPMTVFKSRKQRLADIQARTERMRRILLAAGVDAMDKDLSIGPMFQGVIEQLKALQAAPLEAQEAFLTMLESGIPERWKDLK